MSDLIKHQTEKDGKTESIGHSGEVKVGQWYWVKGDNHRDKDDGAEWFMCVMYIGSNYVKLETPRARHWGRSERVHIDDFFDQCRFEPNPESVIRRKVLKYQQETQQHLLEVKNTTERLGLQNQTSLPNPQADNSRALAVVSSQDNIKQYKKDLVKAKEKTLPELFKKIEESNEQLCRWMTAETMPMLASMGDTRETISSVEDRIFNVELYSGLTEEVVQCKEGEPAPIDTKLHIMQRKLFMDEECLLGYRTGGMEFKNIKQFDKWLCQKDNLERILPFPRCITAMQVRRSEKERDGGGSLQTTLINLELRQTDGYTFLFIRNGDSVYRMNCGIEFDELIFPDAAMFDMGQPMMVRCRYEGRVDEMITLGNYQERRKILASQIRASRKWQRENPGSHWIANPHRHSSFSRSELREFAPFDQTNVYYDDALADVSERIKKYNRIALIIQGLFDRSTVLHPHAPVRTWDSTSFDENIKLVYDGAMVLTHGEAPDFEEYRERCNESIDEDSILVGQELYWELKEAEKECNRLDNNWRSRHTDYRPKKFRPQGNPGPGYLAKPASWSSRSKHATFRWKRWRLVESWRHDDHFINTTIAVPISALFNVSAYKPGDFKKFYQDTRTRAKYLKWAPMLLAAEEYYAGNLKAKNPDSEPEEDGRGG